MADAGKPLTARAREALSPDIGALYRAAAATWELAESGEPFTATALLDDITDMEKILIRLRQAVLAHVG